MKNFSMTELKTGSFEHNLQEIENESAPIFEDVVKAKSIDQLSESKRKTISLFIAAQSLRTKAKLVQMEEFMINTANQLWQKVNIEVPSIIFNKVWALAESDDAFLISDNPLVLQNSINQSEFKSTIGLECFGIEIYLLLTSSLTLCLFCEKYFKSINYVQRNIINFTCEDNVIANLNSLQIAYSERFILSHKNDFSMIL
ncbi:MAG: hypothetical protein ACI9V1_002197 [Spirosomataceae bacterium]